MKPDLQRVTRLRSSDTGTSLLRSLLAPSLNNASMTANASPTNPEDKTDAEEVELNTMADPNEDTSAEAPLISGEHEQDTSGEVALTSNGNAFVWALTISACVSGMLFGYDTGVISSTLVSIGSDLSNRSLMTLDKGLITSSVSAFALVASPIAGVLADKIGRKNIIIFSDVLFVLGALWQAVSGSVWAMILGRAVVGLAIGGASLITPLYISELAPSHIRGRLVTVSLLFITGGQVVAYVVGWAFSSMPGGWRWMVGLGAAPAILQVAMLVFMPETPRYLCKINKEQEAKAVLTKIYRGISNHTDKTVNDIIRAINREITEEQEASIRLQSTKATASSALLPPTLHSLLSHPPHLRALTITCMLQGLQQLCGFNSLMYFSATIFSLLRFSSPTLTSLSIACTNFIFTIVAFYLIDRIGRRRILLLTIPIMAVALLLCAAAFTFVELPHHSTAAPSATARADAATPPLSSPAGSRAPAIAILACLLLYVSAYATALGPVPWQQSELFPLSVRSLGSSIATSTNWSCNTLVGLSFLPMMDAVGAGWTFVGYSVVCAVGWCGIWGIYPETMGMGLEEIGGLLKDGWGVREGNDRIKAVREREGRRMG